MFVRILAAFLGLLLSGMAWADAGFAEIAFVSIRSGDPQIFTRDARGQLRAVTDGKGLYGQPAFASTNRLGLHARVGQATRCSSRTKRVLARAPDQRRPIESSPSWSPDGRALAYYSMPLRAGRRSCVVDVATRMSAVLARNEHDMGPTRVLVSRRVAPCFPCGRCQPP
jgi:Tol biopolymer transport system component